MIWHSAEALDVLNELGVDKNKGLANGVADLRLGEFGKNVISTQDPPSFAKRFLGQLKSKLVYVLFTISIVSFVLSLVYKESDYFSPLLIIAVVIINAVVSAYHLYRCDHAISSLKNATNPDTTIIRDGVEQIIPSSLLVPGDIVIYQTGDYITADCRLIETNNFRCNESYLTGIVIPVNKSASAVVEDITPIEDRINMVYYGTSVAGGSAKAVVVETGLNTEIGHSSTLISQEGSEELPVKSVLDRTEKLTNIIIFIICFLVFILELAINSGNGVPFASLSAKTLMNAIALAVAAIPEGLPAICTVVIALGIQRIIKSDTIIKKTKAIELLGKTTVICSDKTGVITKNHMHLEKTFNKEGFSTCYDTLSDSNLLLLKLASACSTLDNDATENSIENACFTYTGLPKDEIDNLYPRLTLIPFDSERKTMTSINMISGQPIAIVKGAPEILASKFKDFNEQDILKANDEMATEGLRVICIGIKPLDDVPAIPSAEDIENNLIFVGLLGLADPPKSETINALSACDAAGIKTIMITGDNLLTAKAVARRVGILKDGTKSITGAELSELTDDELLNNIQEYSVYARILPQDKLRIIKAWQSSGNIVAVTGDSIADADALGAANIGCAIGENGTDVAKGNADVIIKNNNFASIVNAIRESRGLFANIQKSVAYLLSCNFAEILLYIIGLIFFGAPPLLAVQLLWINLLTDTTPVIALSSQKADYSVMNKKPVTLSGKLFELKNIIHLSIFTVTIFFISLLSAIIGNSMSFNTGMTETGMTMAFLTLSLTQVLHSFNMRSTSSIFKTKLKLKDFMFLSSLVIVFICCFLTLTPAGAVFGLATLTFAQFIIAIALSLIIIPVSETLKFLK